jgi:sugar lactone lactonase YvrE
LIRQQRIKLAESKLKASIKIVEAQPVIEHKCLLGEGPVWDHHNRVIIWVDILKGESHEYNPYEKTFYTLSVGECIGSVALCKDGNFIAALQSGFAIINRRTGQIKKIFNSGDDLDIRFNEGKCDPAGRFFAGTMSMSKKKGKGSFYKLETDGIVTKVLDGLSIPNGMAWRADNKIFYHIDTPTSQVCSYDYDIKTGNISNKKTVITIPSNEGFPDGMTIDTEGMLWIAHWNGGQISRWNPDSGEKLLSIPLPVSNVTSCNFGGDDMSDIYITSARVILNDEEIKQQPLAGSLFIIKNSGFYGFKSFEFAGIQILK